MMNYEEALRLFESGVEVVPCEQERKVKKSEVKEITKIIRISMMKQIPHPVKRWSHPEDRLKDQFRCPACERRLRFAQQDPYCPGCGQALNWEGQELYI